MGRNKKNKPSTAHKVDVEMDVLDEAGAAGDQVSAESATHSETGSINEKSVAKKKKEYHGNKLLRHNACGKKKGQQTDLPAAPAQGLLDAAEAVGVEQETEGAKAATVGDDVVASKNDPVEVLYCPICTFPAEMCEYSGMYEQCRPWLLEHAKELAEAEERGRKRRALTERERLERLVKGSGAKKAIERIVVIEVSQRKGRKMTTSVRGLDLFGLNLVDFSRECKKMFSCGAGVRSSEELKQNSIDIQGNVAVQLIDLLPARYNIPKAAIYQMEDKKRVRCYTDDA